VEKKVRRATAYVCGLGLSELYLNGKKVGDDVLSPAIASYDKRAFYLTYDVTELLRRGDNAVGVILGNGRFLCAAREGARNMPDVWLSKTTIAIECRIHRRHDGASGQR